MKHDNQSENLCIKNLCKALDLLDISTSTIIQDCIPNYALEKDNCYVNAITSS